jgi:hypothetical protein
MSVLGELSYYGLKLVVNVIMTLPFFFLSAASQENGQPGISLEVDGLEQSAVPTM